MFECFYTLEKKINLLGNFRVKTGSRMLLMLCVNVLCMFVTCFRAEHVHVVSDVDVLVTLKHSNRSLKSFRNAS